ncbi:hypothetical protein EB796_004171 [Bugula neritina]|uniref:Uncharacterized protein n=1 Tax=Bugula neritina TaxID=10212 RepID=A0A7J7KI06_BUGNE|nr:hypothetical protein EB796_004171 [Bugula neritina]
MPLCYHVNLTLTSVAGRYLGLPPSADKNYSTLLISPPLAKLTTSLCVTFAYICGSCLIYYYGRYLGLPPPTDKNYSTLLISPPLAKLTTSLCVTFAYSTVGSAAEPNGFIGLYTRTAGQAVKSSSYLFKLDYNIPTEWNIHQLTIK